MPQRITDYDAAAEKTQVAIDYCARHAVVPRQRDDDLLPEPWQGVSTERVREGIAEEFDLDVSTGIPTRTWQRLGADHDVDGALAVLKDRREAMLDAGLDELAAWK